MKLQCFQCKGVDFNHDCVIDFKETDDKVSVFAYHRKCAPAELLK